MYREASFLKIAITYIAFATIVRAYIHINFLLNFGNFFDWFTALTSSRGHQHKPGHVQLQDVQRRQFMAFCVTNLQQNVNYIRNSGVSFFINTVAFIPRYP
jgi:hypothetical protein